MSSAQVTDAGTHITTSVYDHADRLTQTINGNTKSTHFAYDDANRKITETDPDSGVWTTSYDHVGNVTHTANSQPASVTSSFDPINRKTLETFSDTTTHAYTYDSVGNRLTQSSSAGVYTTSYDARNQPTLVTEPGGKNATYQYDAGNRRTAMGAYDQGTFAYSYDKANRQTLIINASTNSATLTYDAVGQKTMSVQQNATTTQTFDEVGNVTSIMHKDGGGAIISQMSHTYDNVNNRLTMSELDATLTTWGYDPVNQLINEYRTGGPTAGFNVTHTYDGAGNRTVQSSSGVVTTFTYSDGNRVQRVNNAGVVTTYTLDGAGNRTSKVTPTETTLYTWDAAGQMAGADVLAGTVSFVYNADGQRASKTSTDGSTIGFLYDYKNLLGETDEIGGEVSTLYTTTTDQEFGDLMDENSMQKTPLADAQANTNAIVGGDGNVLATYKYQAFGAVAAVSVEGDAWSSLTVDQWSTMSIDQWAELPVELSPNAMTGFGGQRQYYLDTETNLLLLGTGTDGRYTQPGELRFTSDDPIRQAGGDNLQRVGENNPISNQDPSGNLPDPYTNHGDWNDNNTEEIRLHDQLRVARVPKQVSELYKDVSSFRAESQADATAKKIPIAQAISEKFQWLNDQHITVVSDADYQRLQQESQQFFQRFWAYTDAPRPNQLGPDNLTDEERELEAHFQSYLSDPNVDPRVKAAVIAGNKYGKQHMVKGFFAALGVTAEEAAPDILAGLGSLGQTSTLPEPMQANEFVEGRLPGVVDFDIGRLTESDSETNAATSVTAAKSGELFSQGARGVEPASDDLLKAVASKGRSVNYATPGSEELRYLDAMKANANVGGEKLTHILLREDPKKIEVLEEFLHGTQSKQGIIERLGVKGAESHVKDFMIRHAKLLGISSKDVDVLKDMLGG